MAIFVSITSSIAFGLVALTLAKSLIHKLAQFGEFQTVLASYQILPVRMLGFFSPMVVLVELLILVAFLTPSTTIAAGYGACLLFLAYGLAISLNLLKGRNDIDCGCGGRGHGITWMHVLRAGVCSILSLYSTLSLGEVQNQLLYPWISMFGILVLWLVMIIFDNVLNTHTHIRLLMASEP